MNFTQFFTSTRTSSVCFWLWCTFPLLFVKVLGFSCSPETR